LLGAVGLNLPPDGEASQPDEGKDEELLHMDLPPRPADRGPRPRHILPQPGREPASCCEFRQHDQDGPGGLSRIRASVRLYRTGGFLLDTRCPRSSRRRWATDNSRDRVEPTRTDSNRLEPGRPPLPEHDPRFGFNRRLGPRSGTRQPPPTRTCLDRGA
jgi:hypothetical protein